MEIGTTQPMGFFHKDKNNNGKKPCNGDEVNACYSSLLMFFFRVQERFFYLFSPDEAGKDLIGKNRKIKKIKL